MIILIVIVLFWSFLGWLVFKKIIFKGKQTDLSAIEPHRENNLEIWQPNSTGSSLESGSESERFFDVRSSSSTDTNNRKDKLQKRRRRLISRLREGDVEEKLQLYFFSDPSIQVFPDDSFPTTPSTNNVIDSGENLFFKPIISLPSDVKNDLQLASKISSEESVFPHSSSLSSSFENISGMDKNSKIFYNLCSFEEHDLFHLAQSKFDKSQDKENSPNLPNQMNLPATVSETLKNCQKYSTQKSKLFFDNTVSTNASNSNVPHVIKSYLSFEINKQSSAVTTSIIPVQTTTQASTIPESTNVSWSSNSHSTDLNDTGTSTTGSRMFAFTGIEKNIDNSKEFADGSVRRRRTNSGRFSDPVVSFSTSGLPKQKSILKRYSENENPETVYKQLKITDVEKDYENRYFSERNIVRRSSNYEENLRQSVPEYSLRQGSSEDSGLGIEVLFFIIFGFL